MISTIEGFYATAQTYVEQFDLFAEKHVLRDKSRADHVCYKCDSREEFERMRAIFEETSPFLYQPIIAHRRIAYIRLRIAIQTVLGDIYFLELSDQKSDGSQRSGFDHIEAYPIDHTYEEFVRRFEKTERVIRVERPHHTTHDIDIGGGFLFRCTTGPLIETIKGEMTLN